MARPPSATKAVGLNQVEKLWRLTFVSTRARIWSQMLVSMQDHQKNRERGTFAHTKAPPLQAFRDLPSREGRKNHVVPTFASGKILEIAGIRWSAQPPIDVFHSVFHSCGNLGEQTEGAKRNGLLPRQIGSGECSTRTPRGILR